MPATAAPGSTFDVIVIGAGPAGEVIAGRLAKAGKSVALVERGLVGGECSFWACMPSKALLRPADALAEVARVPGAAQAVTGALDVAAALARRDEVIKHLDDSGQIPWLEDRGVKLIRGHARLSGERQVRVEDTAYDARDAVVVAVGSAAAMPPIPGLEESRPWTNREATITTTIPERLAILGGGAVGVELAQAFASLGARVTLIEPEDRLLIREEPFAAAEVRAALQERGVDVRVGTRAARVVREAGGSVTLTLEGDDGGTVTADDLLVAAGRRPLTDDLGVEVAGLTPGESIDVDDTLRVPGAPWLYAVGDVNGRSLLTHAGKYQAHVAAQNILGADARAAADTGGPPRVVFTEPQVAAVGIALQAALDAGIRARAVDVPTSGTPGASFHGRNTAGTARLVIDEQRGTVVGATFTGTDVAEWLHAATIAIVSEIPVERLWEAIPAFPTRSEIWLRLLEQREADIAGERRTG